MYIWNVSIYEPLPFGNSGVRIMRSGMLSKSLVESGNEVELWIPGFEHVHHYHYKNESSLECVSNGLSIQYMRGPGYRSDRSLMRFIHNIEIAREFKRISSLRIKKPDLIITQIPSLELAAAAVEYALQSNIPVVVDVRDLWPDIYKKMLPSELRCLYRYIFFRDIKKAQFILRRATAITAVSNDYLEWGLKSAKRLRSNMDKVFYIGYPMLSSCHLLRDDILNKYALPGNKLLVFFCGTFCKSYDLDTLLLAAQAMRSANIDDVHFIVAGKGLNDQQFRIDASMLPNVTYLGWLDSESLAEVMKVSSIGLAPYSVDALMSLPNKLFEYMSFSLAIVSCLSGEMKRFIEDSGIGLYYRAGSSDSLVSTILSLKSNPSLLHEMGRIAGSLFDTMFTEHRVYSEYADHVRHIYESRQSNLLGV